MRRGHPGLLVALALMLAGCSEGTSPEQTTGTSGANFDLYLGERIDLIDHARNVAKAACMKQAGYPQLSAIDREKYNGQEQRFVITPGRFRGFASEAQARERGFGLGYPSEPSRLISYDANFDRKVEECDAEAAKQIDPEANQILLSYKELGNQMSSEFAVFVRQRVPQDLPDLADCLEGEGFPLRDRAAFLKVWDVKHFGIELGSAQQAEEEKWEPDPKKGGVQVGPPLPQRDYTPSPQEADLAAAWYRCDQKSKRVDKLLKDVDLKIGEIVVKYEDKLLEMNPRIEEFAKTAAQMVGTE